MPAAAPARILHAVSVLALAAGVGVWGALLLAPQPRALPPGLTEPPPAGSDTAPLAQWFGGSAASVKVAVVGLISAGERGAAILAINGAAPQAYRVGEAVAQGVFLARVQPQSVVLDQGGTPLEVAAPALPAPASPGIVRVPPQ